MTERYYDSEFLTFIYGTCAEICKGEFLSQLQESEAGKIVIENPREYAFDCLRKSMELNRITPPPDWEHWVYQHMVQYRQDNPYLSAVTKALRPSDQEIQECPELFRAITEAENAAGLARSIT